MTIFSYISAFTFGGNIITKDHSIHTLSRQPILLRHIQSTKNETDMVPRKRKYGQYRETVIHTIHHTQCTQRQKIKMTGGKVQDGKIWAR